MTHLRLAELNHLIKETLDKQLEPTYWVVAEVGEMRQNSSGHCYLELVEKEGSQVSAKIKATIWCYTYQKLSRWFAAITGEELRAGMKILSHVEVKFHELYGLSLNVKDIDANFTLGERGRRRQEVIRQLIADGVMDMNKSLPLPAVPQQIAVISSPTAAGYGDFIDQLQNNRYGYSFGVHLFKAAMQGREAAESIITAMHEVYRVADQAIQPFDLLVIIRGGGTQVDLDCFDAYELASHVAQFPLPVVTGIGHERDETVVDMVAHTKMKTPTAVAEFLIGGMQQYEAQVEDYGSRIFRFAEQVVREKTYQLDSLQAQLKYAVSTQLGKSDQQLLRLKENMKQAVRLRLQTRQQQCEQLHTALKNGALSQLDKARTRLDTTARYLDLLSPEHVLRRGYTMTYVNGKPLATQQKVATGDTVTTVGRQQTLTSIVTSMEPRENA